MSWASRVTSLGLEFALPAWAGHWVDGRLGTKPWLTLLGSCLGFAVGSVHLMQIARAGAAKSKTKPAPPGGREQG